MAVYGSRAVAERARERLTQSGVPAANIRLSESGPAGERRETFWEWLFGSNVPEHDRNWCDTNLRQGRTALSVIAGNDAERDRIVQMLEEFDPIDFDHTAAQTGVAGAGLGTAAPATGRTEIKGEKEQVIPVVKEELDVGKRASERRHRIRTYLVERPIEEAITLRDERVVVEHRPVSGERIAGDAELPKEGEYEVIERHEEPVVGKHARKVEDVVVRKEAAERTETVRGTVRETKVDVEKEEAERAVNPPNRR